MRGVGEGSRGGSGMSVRLLACRGCVRRDQLVGGGQGSCGERPRSHAAVAHGCGRRRPLVSWERRPVVLGRVQGRQREQRGKGERGGQAWGSHGDATPQPHARHGAAVRELCPLPCSISFPTES